ncbi:MAG TPA: protein arginine kinase [Candidatus Omnitrophota bacterium]|jgi:protein arginine kinase|nr:protein arginine kinase [Candidatus Omnitrophota bacterium]HPN56913.1 protein arginine kinase [Candidatus Omnitrophota bacterium]
MKLDDLIYHTGQWLKGTGPYSNIVMSSRIRLARNLFSVPFPNKASKKDLLHVLATVQDAKDKIDYFKDATLFQMNELDSIDRQFLIERHLMSHEHSSNPEGKALIVSQEEILSVMINEEDHLRIQVMQSGLNLHETWKIIDMIDDKLADILQYAFLNHWGYLTACPTNTGTAMRGSVMLHLPALVMTKQINKVLTAIAKLSFASRGFYGEGTQARGNFYQISNQVSLGHSEEDIIQNINGLIRQVIEQEEQARQALILQNKPMLEDKIFRSLGVIKNAHIISSQETIELLSMVRLGIDLGLVKNIDRCTVNELLILIQPAHLQKLEGKKLSATARDIRRASLMREKLGGA